MKEVRFYHLTQTPLEKVLPKLLEKLYLSGQRVLLKCKDDEAVTQWNRYLWSYTTKFFLPHGSKDNSYPEEQPIYLSTKIDTPNHANCLVTIDQTVLFNHQTITQLVDVFNGNDEQELLAARQRWQEYKRQNSMLTYWKQTPDGSWVQG
jgi:DNA polymerase-3 subunit chi